MTSPRWQFAIRWPSLIAVNDEYSRAAALDERDRDLEDYLQQLRGTGGGGGPIALDDLTDVATAGADPGEVLTYTAGGWVPAAPPGGAGTVSYVHAQGAVAATWTIIHNLGWYPNVTVIDSAGSTVEGDVTYLNANTLTVAFSSAFTGNAYLS